MPRRKARRRGVLSQLAAELGGSKAVVRRSKRSTSKRMRELRAHMRRYAR